MVRSAIVSLGLVCLSFLCGISIASAEPDYANLQCAPGWVWRMAGPDDRVCVSPQARDAAQMENAASDQRREPNGGAYGPNTCLPGFVWRGALPGDVTCVPPEARDRVARENRDGPGNVASVGQSVTTAPATGRSLPPRVRVPQGTGTWTGPVQTPASQFGSDRVAPGVYQIKSVHSSYCLGVMARDNGTFNLASQFCNGRGDSATPVIAVVQDSLPEEQTQNPRFTLRPFQSIGRANPQTVGNSCAGTAEDVVVGSPSIDVTQCRSARAMPIPEVCQQWAMVEQQFVFERVDRNHGRRYRIQTGEGYSGSSCMTLRGSSTELDAELISWQCHEAASDDYMDQVFELIPVAALPARLQGCPRR